MNNDLAQVSEERLKYLADGNKQALQDEIEMLARIALSAKQAKPVTDDVLRIMQEEWDEWCSDTGCFPDDFEWKGGNGTLSFEASRWAARIAARVSNLATPQPAHTEQDGWIKCSEQMPEIEEDYYQTFSSAGVDISYFFEGYFSDQNITHWMPLPAAPKPESV